MTRKAGSSTKERSARKKNRGNDEIIMATYKNNNNIAKDRN